MSSTSTTWTTDTNTKSGVVQVYSSNVSVLKVVADEGGSAILDLFADQGDDNADKWRMWVNASDDDLHFSNYTSGTAWTDILTLQDGGNVGIGTDSPGVKLEVSESTSADCVGRIVGGGSNHGILEIWSNSGASADDGWRLVSNNGGKLEIGESSAAMASPSWNTRMVILEGGNVGIGTDSPISHLEVRSPDNSTGGIVSITNANPNIGNNDVLGRINFSAPAEHATDGNEVAASIAAVAQDAFDASTNSTALAFQTGKSEIATTKMLIDKDGSVGIGLTAPGVRFEVKAPTNDGSIFARFIDSDTNSRLALKDNGELYVAGNVGIGTTDPGSALNPLLDTGIVLHTANANHVYHYLDSAGSKDVMTVYNNSDTGNNAWYTGLSSADDYVFNYGTSVTAGNTKVTILPSGDVGIGTTSPSDMFQIQDGNLVVMTNSTNNASENGILFRRSKNATDGAHTAVDSGTNLGRIGWAGSDGDSFEMGASIIAVADETWSGTARGTFIDFYTVDNGTPDLDHRMRIDHNGNVGIGTDSPTANLHILSADTSSGADALNEVDNESEFRIQYLTGTESSMYFGGLGSDRGYIQGTNNVGDAAYDISLNPYGGNIGIGTAAPAYNLTVESDASDSNTQIMADATALANTYVCNFTATGTSGGADRLAAIGLYNHSGITYPASYIRLDAADGGQSYTWLSDNDLLRSSSNASHIGTTSGVAISADVTSDERLKDISTDSFPYGLSEINKLTPIEFTFKKDKEKVKTLGFGAQSTEPILPEVVNDTGICIDGYEYDSDKPMESTSKSDDTKLVMQYHQVIPVLVKAIQELSAKVTALESA